VQASIEHLEVERIVQVSTPLSSSASTPVAWQSVGTLVGNVLANVTVEKTAEFDCSQQLAKPLLPRSNGQER